MNKLLFALFLVAVAVGCDDDGGVCLLACELPEDCPHAYNCEGRENRGHGGDSLVCRD